MISAFSKALAQLSDRRVRRVLWISIAATLALFVALFGAVWFLLRETVLFDFWFLDDIVDTLGIFATLGVTWLLFPALATSIVGLLLEEVAHAVETRHYPHLGPAPGARGIDALWSSAKLIAIMVALNILVLPLYLFPVINLFVFYGLNGYLLGREYFELAALRRMPPAEAYVLRRRRGLLVFLSGAVIAFLLTLPVVNLLAPVVGTAAMVHMVERWRDKGEVPVAPEGEAAKS